MTAIEYSRFNWPGAIVTLDDATTYRDVEVMYDGEFVKLLSMTDSSVLATLIVAPDADGIRRITRHSKSLWDFTGIDGTVWHINKNCGCG